MKKQIWLAAAALAAVTGGMMLAAPSASYGAAVTVQAGVSSSREYELRGPGAVKGGLAPETFPAVSFDVNQFVLPQEARVLVAVEGTGGSSCRVSVYERLEEGWVQRLGTRGVMGANGMSNHRTEGDKTTPVGVFCMNTPFGQLDEIGRAHV